MKENAKQANGQENLRTGGHANPRTTGQPNGQIHAGGPENEQTSRQADRQPNGQTNGQATRPRVAVLFGGRSSEHAISLQSAAAVVRAMEKSRFEAVPVGITREGRWLRFCGSAQAIASGAWEAADCTPVTLSPDPADHGLLVWEQGGVRRERLDAAFPVLHGKNGEDGTVQGLLALADIPCVGCGVLASAVCMDKDIAHRLAGAAGVAVPPCAVLRAEELCAAAPFGAKNAAREKSAAQTAGTLSAGARADRARAADAAAPPERNMQQLLAARTKQLRYPLFVKPARAGSSFGVTRVETPDRLAEAVAAAFSHDDKVLVEQGVPGFEVGCAVLGEGKSLMVGEVDEIELAHGFFDYTEKYTLETARIHMPARLPAAERERIRAAAKTVYRALDCTGFARVDLFYTPEGRIVFNEVNTIPGFTEHSRFPGMMRGAGLAFDTLVAQLIEGTVTA